MKTKEERLITQNQKLKDKILSQLTVNSKLKYPVTIGYYISPSEFTYEKAHYIYNDEGALVIKCDKSSVELDTLYTEDLLAILVSVGIDNVDYYQNKIVSLKTDLYELLETKNKSDLKMKVPKPFCFTTHKLTTLQEIVMCDTELCGLVKDYSYKEQETIPITGFYYDDLLILLTN